MAMTDAQKTARWADFVQWYQAHVSAGRGGPPGKPIPKELKRLYMANDGAWGTDKAMQWIRVHDPNYMRTTMAQSRLDAIKELYEKALGYTVNWKDPRMAKYAEAFARANPNMNVNRRLTDIFMKRILPSAEFKKANPGFASWLDKNRQTYKSATQIMDALTDYNSHKEELTDYWASASTEDMPKSLLDLAIANDWQPNSLAFQQAMANTPEWASGASYQDRARDFDQNWKAIFGQGSSPDETMKDAYAKNMSGLTFSDYFHSTLKNSALFKQKMPGYEAWEAGEEARGNPEGTVDVFTYFGRRTELEEMWAQNFTGGELPDQAFIDQAMKENWGDALFRNKLRTLPLYAVSGVGKDRAETFDRYWAGMFGEFTPVDEAIRSRFIGSDSSDPSVYWDDIKATDTFKKMFVNWDVFSQAQTSAGIDVTADPAEYTRYKEGFTRAFNEIGMEPPPGLERSIFASGVSAEDLQQRAQTWNTTNKAFELQSGARADLAATLGVAGNKAQSGDMRARMEKALAQQKKLSASKFKSFDTRQNQETGFITQKI